jgi:hypothetical protein
MASFPPTIGVGLSILSVNMRYTNGTIILPTAIYSAVLIFFCFLSTFFPEKKSAEANDWVRIAITVEQSKHIKGTVAQQFFSF